MVKDAARVNGLLARSRGHLAPAALARALGAAHLREGGDERRDGLAWRAARGLGNLQNHGRLRVRRLGVRLLRDVSKHVQRLGLRVARAHSARRKM